jgi:hypothetical protein
MQLLIKLEINPWKFNSITCAQEPKTVQVALTLK